MKKTTSFELETVAYPDGEAMQAGVSYTNGRFTFALSSGHDFSISREELASLVDETGEDAVLAPFPLVPFETMGQAEAFLRRYKGRVVSLVVQRKGGLAEQRHFECYSIGYKGAQLVVWCYQRDHEHLEALPLASIRAGRATTETFEPRYDVEL